MINIGIDLGTTNSVIAYTNVKPNGDVISNVVSVKRPVDMYNAAGGTSRLSTEKKLLFHPVFTMLRKRIMLP